jgi:tRNA threonylcarbamoyladenosine biosynthesis protein TsaB
MTSPDSSTPKSVFHLSLEVSTPSGSMALWDREALLWKSEWERSGSHSEMVTSQLAAGFRTAGIEAQDLSFVAAAKGPGSFTGLRVGINIAKTLSMSLKIPIVTLTTLDLLAARAAQDKAPPAHLLTALNAFKGMVYWAAYSWAIGRYNCTHQPQAHTWRDVAQQLDLNRTYTFLGDGYLPLKGSIPEELSSKLDFRFGEQTRPSALTLGPLSYFMYQERKTINWQQFVPLYIRRSEAEEKKREKTSEF